MKSILALWQTLWRPTTRVSMGVLLIIGFLSGIIFWGGFNWTMELSNTEQFCISCHEMRDNVFEESKQFVHYSNRSGVRAECADCHVPNEWHLKMIRKIEASREIYHKVLGTIDTPEKFEARRLAMAERVWATMKANDSRECRNCHDVTFMSESAQKKRAWTAHSEMQETGETCIDCHKGIAHKAVHETEEEDLEDFDFGF